jgi:small Trp-rich protein
MWFIVVGVLLIALKVAEFGPFADWSWWLVLSPFALASVWWAYADGTGLTRRREMEKLEQRKIERRRKNMEALGIDRHSQKLAERADRARAAAGARVEGKRSAVREHNEKVVRDSVFDSSQQSTGFGDEPPKKP